MALEHAILVSLLEQPGSGYELARRFERSIGRFWTATHQQIYRVLKRMESDGLVDAEEIGQDGRPDKRAYSVTAIGRSTLVDWLREPVQPEAVRHDLAVKIRGAAFDDEAGRTALIAEVVRYRIEHETTLNRYLTGERRDFPDETALDTGQRLQHVVLRGGIAYERMLLDWLDDVLTTLRHL
ncbi:putative PadR-like family transcriptional regulator [Actinoplanes missouriensis 431]|uniref:Putative PadR-like family transcriptional regulator n=1 Tax=Actinoplanes missouriensis (strain ATCC 14538 / DSM 43046 / CBS 188.64 / JCM 3121 / NBRC 102363 / NCIMB 12654 / NRRL B-3342 / UNCC 431) TaxID=512565 RepID=I0H334_ACTM4|nr:PadR family transcriptional regulator [Actinoplanes missouriensis]BAL87421.1 putative PadR-like family transcriptional regulator [Actinoplanes missouriensis 431]